MFYLGPGFVLAGIVIAQLCSNGVGKVDARGRTREPRITILDLRLTSAYSLESVDVAYRTNEEPAPLVYMLHDGKSNM